MISAGLRSRLLAAARRAVAKAYAPYSQRRVGAALLTGRGAIFSGANLENASFGLTLCAERVAIAAAAAAEGPDLKIQALAVVSDPRADCPPCGACRQVIREFGAEALIIFPGPDGLVEMNLKELLPAGFQFPGKEG